MYALKRTIRFASSSSGDNNGDTNSSSNNNAKKTIGSSASSTNATTSMFPKQTATSSTAADATAAAEVIATKRAVSRKILQHMGVGVIVISIPVGIWWYWSIGKREEIRTEYRKQKEQQDRIPVQYQSQDTFDYLITNKCLPGDVILFDRRWERCATSPWAALSCWVAKSILCNIGQYSNSKSDCYVKTIDTGSYDHIGIIVPGYVTNRTDALDPTNLLLLEATPSGIVARNLKERLQQSASRSVLLLQLNCPGEERNKMDTGDDDSDSTTGTLSSRMMAVQRTRQHMEKELCTFRDTWIAAGDKINYQNLHSTIVLGGALLYATGLLDYGYIKGPVSPAAFVVLCGLQKAAAAPNISERDNHNIKVEDYLRVYRFSENHAIRLRPGWRFLAPVPLKESST